MMASTPSTVYLYFFDAHSSYTTTDRLNESVRAYLREQRGEKFPFPSEIESALEIQRTSRGKPYLPFFPNLHISASHSGEYLICAVSDTVLGIDIQEHSRLKGETEEEACIRLRRIANRFLHPQEANYISPRPSHRFFNVWTAKESYVKYTGQGIDHHFSEFSVLPQNLAQSWESDSTVPYFQWSASDVSFYQFQFNQQYTVCICTEDLAEIKICKL